MQDADAATLDLKQGTLTLAGVRAEITYFADRPARTAGHESTRDFVGRWTELFGTDPPNAGLQAVDASGTDQPVVLELLRAPTVAGSTLVFTVKAVGATSAAGPQSLRDVSLFIDGADPAGLALPTSAATSSAAATHTVTVVNRSSSYKSVVIYQDPSRLGPPGAQALAWLTAMSWPQSTVTFTWSENYSFVWGPDGVLLPGVIFQAAQSVAADPDSSATNHIALGFRAGSIELVPGGYAGTPSGSVSITSDQDVPGDSAAVGVAMNGSPVFAAPTDPDLTTLLRLGQPRYLLATGAYQQGQVLDLSEMGNSAALAFPSGTNALTVVLQADGSTSVLPN